MPRLSKLYPVYRKIPSSQSARFGTPSTDVDSRNFVVNRQTIRPRYRPRKTFTLLKRFRARGRGTRTKNASGIPKRVDHSIDSSSYFRHPSLGLRNRKGFQSEKGKLIGIEVKVKQNYHLIRIKLGLKTNATEPQIGNWKLVCTGGPHRRTPLLRRRALMRRNSNSTGEKHETEKRVKIVVRVFLFFYCRL